MIRRIVRRAVTDRHARLDYDPAGQPGIANLAEITAALTDHTPVTVLEGCSGYGDLKDACADAIISDLEPIQRRHDDLLGDPAEMTRMLRTGAERARAVAGPTLARAQSAIGVLGVGQFSHPRVPQDQPLTVRRG